MADIPSRAQTPSPAPAFAALSPPNSPSAPNGRSEPSSWSWGEPEGGGWNFSPTSSGWGSSSYVQPPDDPNSEAVRLIFNTDIIQSDVRLEDVSLRLVSPEVLRADDVYLGELIVAFPSTLEQTSNWSEGIPVEGLGRHNLREGVRRLFEEIEHILRYFGTPGTPCVGRTIEEDWQVFRGVIEDVCRDPTVREDDRVWQVLVRCNTFLPGAAYSFPEPVEMYHDSESDDGLEGINGHLS